MRCRHLGVFPFRFYEAGAGSNPTEVEPITLTLKQAVEWWWRLSKVKFEYSFEIDYGGDTQTFTETTFGTGTEIGDRGITHPAYPETRLCRPGAGLAIPGETGANEFSATSGEESFSFGAGIYPTDLAGAANRIDLFSAEYERRGTWTDVSTVKPAIYVRVFLSFYKTFPQTQWDFTVGLSDLSGTHDQTGTFSGSLFGETVTWHWGTNAGGYDAVTVNSTSLSISKHEWLEYRDADGNNPVWDSATGAQLLDPLTAEVT